MKYKCENCSELLEAPTSHQCVLSATHPDETVESLETFDNGSGGIDQIRVQRIFSGGYLMINIRNSTPQEISDYLAQVAIDNAQFLEG